MPFIAAMFARWAVGAGFGLSSKAASALAAVAVGVVGLITVVGGVWIWIATHDSAIKRAATQQCHAEQLAASLAVENAAYKAAIEDRSRRLAAAGKALDDMDQKLKRLEAEKQEARNAAAKMAGGDAVVFDVGDPWLQQGRTAAQRVGTAGRR